MLSNVLEGAGVSVLRVGLDERLAQHQRVVGNRGGDGVKPPAETTSDGQRGRVDLTKLWIRQLIL